MCGSGHSILDNQHVFLKSSKININGTMNLSTNPLARKDSISDQIYKTCMLLMKTFHIFDQFLDLTTTTDNDYNGLNLSSWKI